MGREGGIFVRGVPDVLYPVWGERGREGKRTCRRVRDSMRDSVRDRDRETELER